MFRPKIGLLGKIDVLKGLQWVEKGCLGRKWSF